MIKKYIKKPIPIQAIQWTCDIGCQYQLQQFVQPPFSIRFGKTILDSDFAFIKTLQGQFRLEIGDYVIKGIMGQFYSSNKEIFEQSYQQIQE